MSYVITFDIWEVRIMSQHLFRKCGRNRTFALHVLPDVLRFCEPRLRITNPPKNTKLEASIQILPLVSV